MNASEFVAGLTSLQPDKEALAALGFTGTLLEEMMRTYECRMIHPSRSEDPLIDLCCSYDVSNVEIGYVQLRNVTELNVEPIQFGLVEVDPLLYVPSTGAIWVSDHIKRNHVVWECASNAHGFLDALLMVAKTSTQRMLGEQIDAAAEKDYCVRASGGARYDKFWSMLLGI